MTNQICMIFNEGNEFKSFRERLKEDVLPQFDIIYHPILKNLLIALEDENTIFKSKWDALFNINFITFIDGKNINCDVGVRFDFVYPISVVFDLTVGGHMLFIVQMFLVIDDDDRLVFRSIIIDDSNKSRGILEIAVDCCILTKEKKITKKQIMN